MAVEGINTCTPARIFGPLPQTLFCGLTVKNFSVNVGWNEQSSSLTVELVEDTCSGFKYYWDANLNRQVWESPDPGFVEPEPGCAAYFRIEENPKGVTEALRGGFEYCGIIESWSVKYDAGGNGIYYVKMTDPRSILSNTEILVNDYVGNTEDIFNLINVYGFVESLGAYCQVSEAKGIGGKTGYNKVGSIANERGMVWNDVKGALQTLTSSVNQKGAHTDYGEYCRHARLVHVGPVTGKAGWGVLAHDTTLGDPSYLSIANANLNANYYTLDLSEIPFAPTYYRVSGPNISLSSLISEVCSAVGCDYYLELLPVRAGGKILKVIKVRVASRRSQPVSTEVTAYIAARNADHSIISYSKGEELRNEDTSVFIPGGKIRDPYTVYSTTGVTSEEILPYWGMNTSGNLHSAYIDSSGWYNVYVDCTTASSSLTGPLPSKFMRIHEHEMLAALGSQKTWIMISILRAVQHHNVTGLGNWLTGIGIKSEIDLSTAAAIGNQYKQGIPADAILGFDSLDKNMSTDVKKDVQVMYDFVRNFTSQYYGKQFLINASNILCYAIDTSFPDSPLPRFSHEPSTEGCWVADGTVTIGYTSLPHNSIYSDFVRDDQGKYAAYLEYNKTGLRLSKSGMFTHTGLIYDPYTFSGDLTSIGNDNKSISGEKSWVKASINPKWMLGTNLNPHASVASFRLTIDSPVTTPKAKDLNTTKDQAGFAIGNEYLGGVKNNAIDLSGWPSQGKSLLDIPAGMIAMSPVAAMSPILSNVDTYGPWGVKGLPGAVQFTSDDSFVPWEFGSDTLMNAAALESVANAVTQMRKGERGSITVAGFPNLPIGAELFSADAASVPHCMGTQKYFGTRVPSFNDPVDKSDPTQVPYGGAVDGKYATYTVEMGGWTGQHGPNITSINISVGANGFTTSYEFSTYVPQFGVMQKKNAERLRKIGQDRILQNRNLRSYKKLLSSAKIGIAASTDGDDGGGGGGDKKNLTLQDSNDPKANKPTTNLTLASYDPSNKRKEVDGIDLKSLGDRAQNTGTWNKLAYVSQDWFHRPVSIFGGTSGTGIAPEDKMSRFPAFRPIITQPADTTYRFSIGANQPYAEYTGLNINRDYLNPLSQSGSTLLEYSITGDASGVGHDIEIVAHATDGAPTGALTTTKRGYSPTYDYRFMALRGPLVVQSWGYDIQNKPIPNEIDTVPAAISGQFTHTGVTDNFMSGWLQEPKSWPVAPLDLRFDRARAVWTMPQPPRMVHVEYTGCGTGSMTGLTVTNPTSGVFNISGELIKTPTISQMHWPWSIAPPSGIGKIPVYYDTEEGKHYGLPYNRLDAQQIRCEPTGTGEYSGSGTNTTLWKDIKKLAFGGGLVVHKSDNHTINIYTKDGYEECFNQNTTTTTTTLSPADDGWRGLDCDGECKWKWVAGTSATSAGNSGEWILQSEDCASATTTTTIYPYTTTTTTTTSTSTTTTTCDPSGSGCPPVDICLINPSGDPTTTTSTTAFPTTTTPAPCQCIYPPVCGTADGDIAYTDCQRYTNDHPHCPSGTTTTCPPDPPDCPPTTTTTQTTMPPCEGDCLFIAYPYACPGVGQWHWVRGDCPGELDSRWWYDCHCAYPSAAPSECGECATTACHRHETSTTGPPCQECCGSCQWCFVCMGSTWILFHYSNGCYTGPKMPPPPAYCGCVGPDVSEDCDECGDCLEVWTSCKVRGQTTTSTTECPCEEGTTTTPDPCEQMCIWKWDGVKWVNVVNCPDPASCACIQPLGDGENNGDIKYTDCVIQNTTTSTTTTTTSTTTTTTVAPTTTAGPTTADPCDQLGACCGYPAADACREDITICQCEDVAGHFIWENDCDKCFKKCDKNFCALKVVLERGGPLGPATCSLEVIRDCGGIGTIGSCDCVAIDWEPPPNPWACPVGDIIMGECKLPDDDGPEGGKPLGIKTYDDGIGVPSSGIRNAGKPYFSNRISLVPPAVSGLTVSGAVPVITIHSNIIKPSIDTAPGRYLSSSTTLEP